MILDSVPWKQGLLRDATKIEESCIKRRGARRTFEIEETVFIAAFKMRRLLESEKVSTSLSSRSIDATFYPCIKPGINSVKRFDLDEFYDLRAGQSVRISVRFLVNSIIHSFVYCEFVRIKRSRRGKRVSNRIAGFAFNAERDSNKGIWQVDMDGYVALLRAFGSDSPTRYLSIFDKDKDNWRTWIGNGNPPEDFTRFAVAKVRQPEDGNQFE